MLILIHLDDPDEIFPNVAIEKRVSPFGRLGRVGCILSILAKSLDNQEIEGILAMVCKEPR